MQTIQVLILEDSDMQTIPGTEKQGFVISRSLRHSSSLILYIGKDGNQIIKNRFGKLGTFINRLFFRQKYL